LKGASVPKPVSGVRVYLSNPQSGLLVADSVTGGDGGYYLGDVKPGRYVLRVDPKTLPKQYEVTEQERTVEVKPTREEFMEIEMADFVATVRKEQPADPNATPAAGPNVPPVTDSNAPPVANPGAAPVIDPNAPSAAEPNGPPVADPNAPSATRPQGIGPRLPARQSWNRSGQATAPSHNPSRWGPCSPGDVVWEPPLSLPRGHTTYEETLLGTGLSGDLALLEPAI
jgi:hypothetical protein